MDLQTISPQIALDYVVVLLDPVVLAWRAPAAVLLLGIVAFRPWHPSRCVMIGRALVFMACVFWIVAAIPAFESAGRVGDWLMFCSAMATHVCEVAMNWPTIAAMKRLEGPSPLSRIWVAVRGRRLGDQR